MNYQWIHCKVELRARFFTDKAVLLWSRLPKSAAARRRKLLTGLWIHAGVWRLGTWEYEEVEAPGLFSSCLSE